MDRKAVLWTGVGVGVAFGLRFFLDPHKGRRRRAWVGNVAKDAVTKTGHAIGTVSVHAAKGAATGTKAVVMTVISPLRSEHHVSDDVLARRILTRIDRAVANPRAIIVAAKDGNITLSGPVFRSDLHNLLSCVWKIRGVRGVENRLDVQERPEGEIMRLPEMHHMNWRRAGALAGATGGALLSAMYARERMRMAHHGIIHNAVHLIPFVKHNHVTWWQRPFA